MSFIQDTDQNTVMMLGRGKGEQDKFPRLSCLGIILWRHVNGVLNAKSNAWKYRTRLFSALQTKMQEYECR